MDTTPGKGLTAAEATRCPWLGLWVASPARGLFCGDQPLHLSKADRTPTGLRANDLCNAVGAGILEHGVSSAASPRGSNAWRWIVIFAIGFWQKGQHGAGTDQHISIEETETRLGSRLNLQHLQDSF